MQEVGRRPRESGCVCLSGREEGWWHLGNRALVSEGKGEGKRVKHTHCLRVQPFGIDKMHLYVMVPLPSLVKTVFWGSWCLGVVGI